MSNAGGYCIGCRRTPDEIAQWWHLTEQQRCDLLDKIQDRGRHRQGDRCTS